MEQKSAVQYLDTSPFTRRHYRVLGLLGGAGFFDGFDIYLAGPLLADLVLTGFSTVVGNASFLSATFFGLLIGTLIAGVTGDRFGRKFSNHYNLLLYGLTTVACAFVPTITELTVLRFFAGLGLGGVIVGAYGMWSEFVPKQTRAFWGGIMSLVLNLSQPASALVALVLIPYWGWRALFLVAGIPAVVMWVLQIVFLPESPRWLETHGRADEAYRIVKKLVPNLPDQEISSVDVPRETATHTPVQKVSIRTSGMLRITVFAIIISVIQMVNWYAFTAWVPTFFVRRGFTVVNTLTYSLVIMSGAIPGNLIAAFLGDRLGRKWTLIAVSILMGVIGWVYAGIADPIQLELLGFTFVMFGNVMIAVLLAVYIPEMFPTTVRMRGSSLANAFGRAGTVLSPYLVAFLYSAYGETAVFGTSLILYVIMAIVILLIGTETKLESLEEISKEVVVGPKVVS
jgi:putative MFS transporter